MENRNRDNVGRALEFMASASREEQADMTVAAMMLFVRLAEERSQKFAAIAQLQTIVEHLSKNVAERTI